VVNSVADLLNIHNSTNFSSEQDNINSFESIDDGTQTSIKHLSSTSVPPQKTMVEIE